jgi:RNA polymerase sigma-70 factor (ECF subfamily)
VAASDPVLSFEDLYRACAQDVYRFALYLSGDAALAEDLTSEAFVRAWNSSAPVRHETVKAYLFTIVRNLYLRERARRSRQAELSDMLTDPAAGMEQTVDRKERARTALEALRRLPEIDRSALLMRADELSYKQIAASLGLSLAATRVRVHRARLKLAEFWREA